MRSRLGITVAIGTSFAVLLSASVVAASQITQIGGVYKKLSYSDETGDLLGMAADIHQGSKAKITVTTCEGGCSGGKTWPLSISGQAIVFTVCDDLVDQNGRPAPCNPIKYVGRILPNGRLLVQVENAPETKTVLKRAPRPKPDEVRKLALVAG